MAKTSIIIPARNEQYMSRTVDEVFAKATGEFEVIVVLDGVTTWPLPRKRPNLVIINKPESEGMRPAINSAAKVATGKYLMKLDAHCAVGEGFDEVLQEECEDNWIVIPRRYTLDADTWKPQQKPGKSHMPIDYHYLTCPWTHPKYFVMRDLPWTSRTKARINIPVDETMTFQGPCWFLSANNFHNRLHGMQTEIYGNFCAESQEFSFKTWLGGGRVIVNKNTWYAHLGNFPGRPHYVSTKEQAWGWGNSARYWTENKWEARIHDFDWLIERFWPLPMKDTLHRGERYPWPENWRDYYEGKLGYMEGVK